MQEPDVVEHRYNPSTQEAEVEDLEFEPVWVHSKFQARRNSQSDPVFSSETEQHKMKQDTTVITVNKS